MADKEKLQATEEKAAELEQQINLLKGSIKMDVMEASKHKTIEKGLGDYIELRQLIAGDYAFETRFQKTARIEHKTWDGLIADIGTRRVTDQLRRQSNDISILLIEGWITTTHSGMLRTQTREYKHRPFIWLWNYLLSVQFSGTYIYFSTNEHMTSKIILAIFDYLNKEEHTALTQRQRLISINPGLTPKQVTLSSIPTVGGEMAKRIDEYFHSSFKDLCNAEIDELTKIEGVGRRKAEIIYKYVRNLI